MVKSSISEGYRRRRKELRLTLKQLAEMAGISVNTLNKLELGIGNPSLEVMLKIGDILGLELTLKPKSLNN